MKDKSKDKGTILGVSTENLAGMTEKDLLNNEAAIKMLLHYYSQLVEENQIHKNNINTLETYASAYEKKSSNSQTGTILLTIGGIIGGFATSLLTLNTILPGIILTLTCLTLVGSGIYFCLFKDNS